MMRAAFLLKLCLICLVWLAISGECRAQLPDWAGQIVKIVNDRGDAGSGLVIGETAANEIAILTAYHVVAETKTPPKVQFLLSPSSYRTKTSVFPVHSNPEKLDIALVLVAREPAIANLPFRALRYREVNEADVRPNDPQFVSMVGPLEGRDWVTVPNNTITIPSHQDNRDWFVMTKTTQTDGFSGTPVVDQRGEVLGIYTSKQGNQNGFGTKITAAIDQIKAWQVPGLDLKWLLPAGEAAPPNTNDKETGSIVATGCPAGATMIVDGVGTNLTADGGPLRRSRLEPGTHKLRMAWSPGNGYWIPDPEEEVPVKPGEDFVEKCRMRPNFNGTWTLGAPLVRICGKITGFGFSTEPSTGRTHTDIIWDKRPFAECSEALKDISGLHVGIDLADPRVYPVEKAVFGHLDLTVSAGIDAMQGTYTDFSNGLPKPVKLTRKP